VEVTKTTATFVGVTAGEALRMVQRMQDVAADTFGKTGGPYASLHAVVRKVNALAAAEIQEAQARSEARAEADAASDPLVALLNDTTPMPADSSELADLAAALETTVEELAGSVHVMRDGGLVITADAPLLDNTSPDPATGLTYGAAIRPKAWVTAHVDSEPVRERAYRSKPGAGRVGGRLLVKCGRRRNRG
jgi:hypothetical protein